MKVSTVLLSEINKRQGKLFVSEALYKSAGDRWFMQFLQ